jgi:hypothetical protein
LCFINNFNLNDFCNPTTNDKKIVSNWAEIALPSTPSSTKTVALSRDYQMGAKEVNQAWLALFLFHWAVTFTGR